MKQEDSEAECDVPVVGISHFLVVSEKFGSGKSLGIGIGKIWYRKKVSEPVSEKVGTEKSTGIGIENIWYRKKVSVSVSFKILGTVTHCTITITVRFSPRLFQSCPLQFRLSVVSSAFQN